MQPVPRYKSGIPAIENENFAYMRYSFNDIVASTVERAKKVVEGVGGEVSETETVLPVPHPFAPPLEQWESDPPILRIEVDEPSWEWTGD